MVFNIKLKITLKYNIFDVRNELTMFTDFFTSYLAKDICDFSKAVFENHILKFVRNCQTG